MITEDYLNGLTLDQLHSIRDKSVELITERKVQKRHTVWCVVHGSASDIKFFREEDYPSAVEYLVTQGRLMALDPHLKNQVKRLALDFMSKSQSDYDEIFEDESANKT